MDRRSFIRLGVAGTATGIVAPQVVLAGNTSVLQSKLAGSVFYTKDAPGRWSKKIGGHLPHLEKQSAGGELKIQVATGHEMKGFEHYIVKHMLLDSNFNYIAENMFDPMKDKTPVSYFTLSSNYRGPVYALSVCNKHDTWLNMLEV